MGITLINGVEFNPEQLKAISQVGISANEAGKAIRTLVDALNYKPTLTRKETLLKYKHN